MGCTAPWGQCDYLEGPKGHGRGKWVWRCAQYEHGVLIFMSKVTSDQTLVNWSHFVEPVRRADNAAVTDCGASLYCSYLPQRGCEPLCDESFTHGITKT